MKFERVFLIAPPSSSRLGAVRPPTGLGYLAQALDDAGIPCQVEDMRVGGSMSALRQHLNAFRPDLIGVSLVSYEYLRSYDLIRTLKAEYPEATIIVGGAHLAALGPRVLDECSAIDIGVMHEGERVLVDICRGERPLEEMQGIVFRKGDTVVTTPPAPVIENLDEVSYPRYRQFNMDAYAREIPLITSRGCPYQCIFCPNSLMARGFRARSAKHVVDEIEYWRGLGYKVFVVDDDNFTLQKQRVYDICDEIEQRGLNDLFIRCANGVRADRVDRALLARLREIGVREVGFGVDGGNNHVLMDIVHKGETIETIEQAIRDALDVGIDVRMFIILGHPGETMADVEDSLALAQRYPVILLHLNNPIPYPGTELYRWVEQNDRFLIPPERYLNEVNEWDNEPIFDTEELPAEVRRQVNRRARKIERDVWRKATERMLPNIPVVRPLAGWVFATRLGRWMFFKNMFTRSLINRIWYGRAAAGEGEQCARV